MKKKTRTFWTVVALILVVEVATVLVVRYWYDIFPPHNVGIIYNHYDDNAHIDASFVKGYRINDTLRVDVTTLKARDSIGFAQMLKDFSLKHPEEIRLIMDSVRKASGIDIEANPYDNTPKIRLWLAPRNNPWGSISKTQPDDYQMFFYDSTIFAFDTKTYDERDAVQGRKFYEAFKDDVPDAEEFLDIPHQNRLKKRAQENNKSSK